MKYVIFILGLAQVSILFASAIALAILIARKLGTWLRRLVAERSETRKPVKRPRKISPVPQTAEH